MLTTALLTLSLHAAGLRSELLFDPETRHNHSASIVVTPGGDLLACWYRGSGERKADDVRIVGARKAKGARTWSEPFVMADSQDLPDCNPVVFIDGQQRLWLIWVAIQDNEWGSALLKYRLSSDYEEDAPPVWDWQDVVHCRPVALEAAYPPFVEAFRRRNAERLEQEPRVAKELEAGLAASRDKLSRRLGWMPRCQPIALPSGELMLGLYSDVFNCSIAAFTAEGGERWRFSETILDYGAVQPSFVIRGNGDIVAFMRDNGFPLQIRTSVSHDGGVTWGPVGELDIPNPGSSVACMALDSGGWLLVCNDTKEGRHRLTAYLSLNEGRTWPHARVLEAWPSSSEGAASYPSLVQGANGAIHCVYSYVDQSGGEGLESIKHAEFSEEWLREGRR